MDNIRSILPNLTVWTIDDEGDWRTKVANCTHDLIPGCEVQEASDPRDFAIKLARKVKDGSLKPYNVFVSDKDMSESIMEHEDFESTLKSESLKMPDKIVSESEKTGFNCVFGSFAGHKGVRLVIENFIDQIAGAGKQFYFGLLSTKVDRSQEVNKAALNQYLEGDTALLSKQSFDYSLPRFFELFDELLGEEFSKK